MNPMTEAMYYVLLALHSPLHGYAIMEAINGISNGRVQLGPGTLYGILKRLQKNKFIQLENSDGWRKVYQITDKGREAVKLEYIRLTHMVRDGKILLEKDGQNGQ